jgi:hypothetical protein
VVVGSPGTVVVTGESVVEADSVVGVVVDSSVPVGGASVVEEAAVVGADVEVPPDPEHAETIMTRAEVKRIRRRTARRVSGPPG